MSYGGRGVVTNDEGELEYGYKLGSLRSLLDDGGIGVESASEGRNCRQKRHFC